MKKILIVNNNMHIGGVQKALISLLWNIRDRYDVTLLLFCKEGECCKDIPSGITVMTVTSGYRFLGMSGQDARSLGDKLGRSFFAGVTRIFGRRYATALMGLGQKPMEGYDVAISYLHNAGDKTFYGGCNDFVLKHVRARKKVAFLHCDYLRSGANTRENNAMYSCFDSIAACSQGCADAFLQANPSLEEKVRVVPNCHRFDRIRELARQSPAELRENVVNIVMVSRLGREKGVERAMRVISRLGDEKDKIHCYVIGDGIQRKTVQQIIDREGLSGCVTLCGTLSNPYGYIQEADLLWIPSYSEAAPLVIGEAVCLGTPVLSTETSSAREMIETPGYGWVCGNSEDGMYDAMKMLLKDRSILHGVQKRLLGKTFSNAPSLWEFDRLVN